MLDNFVIMSYTDIIIITILLSRVLTGLIKRTKFSFNYSFKIGN
jgi:hypothetical protein